jgi:superoxide dismutase, Fe-Mn family
MSHVLPPLPYEYDALEPHIDAQTMKLHHDIHHKGYVDGLNKAEEGLAKARESGDYAAVKHLSREAAFHGSGHFLHTIFWEIMGPDGGAPEGELKKKIEADFGSVDACLAQFTAASNAVEGSGWGILAYRKADDKLVILQAEKHQNLTQWGVTPILVNDVWEHAYYLNYQNKRPAYTKAFLNVINWKKVGELYQAAK